jgi:cysteine-S-conjugate beta-lyase
LNPSKSFEKKLGLAIAAGRELDTPIRGASLPVQRASTILFDTVEQAHAMGPRTLAGQTHATSYGTVGTTTTFALMDAVALLEGGGTGFRAALMPSGLSAISTLFLALLKPGDHILVSDSVYGPARVFCETMLQKFGIQTSYVPADCDANIEPYFLPNTKLVYLESPGSYTFELQDIPAVCEVAHRHGALVAIDNAWASPLYANPFDWGIDFSVLPLTKHWAGHSDVLMGALVCKEKDWPLIWPSIRQLGVCVSSDDAWLVLRGIRSAAVRMQQCSANAQTVIHWLQQQVEVQSVLWPALETHPQHHLWKRDFAGAASLFSVEFAPSISAQQINAMCNSLQHFGIGYSWGGFESLIMPAVIARALKPWTGGPLVRFNIGLENPSDLIHDLEQAFKMLRAHS